MNATKSESYKLFNSEDVQYGTIVVEERKKNTVTHLLDTKGKNLLSMSEKKNCKGVKFSKDLKKMGYGTLCNLQKILDFQKFNNDSGVGPTASNFTKVEGGFKSEF